MTSYVFYPVTYHYELPGEIMNGLFYRRLSGYEYWSRCHADESFNRGLL